MPEISITLPSLRPKDVLKRIKEFSITNKDSDYEIIVVSPFTIKEDKVVHIYEEEQLGNILAQNIAYKNSSGEYIVWWADDVSPTKNCLSNMLTFMKRNRDPFIGAFRVKGRRWLELEQWSVYHKLYACWGCASRNTINITGGYLDPIFRNFWADPDMSLRTWENGGRVEVCPNAWVVLNQIEDKIDKGNRSKYFKSDTEAFLDRWHHQLGKGMERNGDIINQPIIAGKRAVLLNKTAKFYWTFVPKRVREVIRLLWSK